MLRRIFPISMLLVMVGAFGFLQAWQKDYKDQLPFIPPKPPQDSLKAFKTRPGFKIDLIASEPLIGSPVAMDFDENSNLYVAEYPEYNAYANPDFKQQGRIKLLQDSNNDGVYDKSTVFADDIPYAASVFCYDGGIFVGAAPDIWFLKDTNNDGKADIRKKVLSGFGRDHAGEAMLNSFRWGLDNRIHISTGMAGGEIRLGDDTKGNSTQVRNQTILLDPTTLSFDKTSGGGQHGFSLDNYNRAYICSNSEPAQILSFDTRYLSRNPYVQAPAPAVNITPGSKFTRIFRISPDEPWRILRTDLRTKGVIKGSNEGGKVSGFFTGATGITSYRGDAFDPKHLGDIFVGEVSGNLIYQARLDDKGIIPIANRAEPEVEFLASADNWFRPVQMANAPDGCLYVVDMYRGLIEGAAFMPPEMVKHLNVMAGFDRGRIWRISPENFKPKSSPKLGSLSSSELVALLEHPNGWHRDTASRLLFQKQDKSITNLVRDLSKNSKSHLGKIHALWVLQGLSSLENSDVLQALDDQHPRVREQALLLSEKLPPAKDVRSRMITLLKDPDNKVRLQAIYSLAGADDATSAKALGDIAIALGKDPYFRLALLCASPDRTEALFSHLINDKSFRVSADGMAFLGTQAKNLSASGLPRSRSVLVAAINTLSDAEKPLANTLIREVIESPLRTPVEGNAGKILDALILDARKSLADSKANPIAQASALKLLSNQEFANAQELLKASLDSSKTPMVHQAALEALAKYEGSDAALLVINAWPGLGPKAKATALEALLSRNSSTELLLDAITAKKIPKGEIDLGRLKLASGKKDSPLAKKIAQLADASSSSRLEVFNQYKKALETQGDKIRGKEVFKAQCSACHQLEGVGKSVGADLSAARSRGLESILLNIIDPNREVKPAFVTYVVTTTSGKIITGMIASESANSLTLWKADHQNETILRNNIEEMRSTGISFMPEGVEKNISITVMADLLAYLDSIR